MTAIDLITSALRLIGVTASGEQPTGEEASDALVILNQMIDSWNEERLNVLTITISNFSLTTGTQVYTLGTGVTFNATRPAAIYRISIISLANPAQPLELPMEMLTDAQWREIPVKNITSALPLKVYDDGSFPLRNLSYWPIPTIAVQTAIYGWTALTQFASQSTDLTFPPGYLKALRYNLAVDLAPEFMDGASASPSVLAQAAQ